ncbi:RNA polymerase sigma factor [Streptomyces sp. NPDC005506]|uniref:RNA polymerase sigma factor n=1 Tax=Streptomyces sp. NPDC005506 TaxID=3364718 RepID=UPI0036C89531
MFARRPVSKRHPVSYQTSPVPPFRRPERRLAGSSTGRDPATASQRRDPTPAPVTRATGTRCGSRRGTGRGAHRTAGATGATTGRLGRPGRPGRPEGTVRPRRTGPDPRGRPGRLRGSLFLARQPKPKETEDFAEASAERLDHQRELAAVREVLDRLRQPEREVLALCVWAGLDYAQAAAALDVPVGTVRSRLSRARARLRSLAGERLAEDRLSEGRREPGAGRGEVGGRAAFVALPNEGGSR